MSRAWEKKSRSRVHRHRRGNTEMNRSLLGGAERPSPDRHQPGRRGQVRERRDRVAGQTTRQPVLMWGISFRYAPKRFAGASLQLTPHINTGGNEDSEEDTLQQNRLIRKAD